MQTFKKVMKYGSTFALAIGAAAANAAVPTEITEAISTMKADGVTVATAFVVASIAVAAIKFLRSAK